MAREEGTYKGGSLQPSVGLQENVSQEMLCKKKEGKAYLIIVMLFAMLLAMLFAAIVNHIGVRIMIFAVLFAMLFAMLFAPYGKFSIKFFKGLREEAEEGEEGFLDEGENLKEITRSLLMVDNVKAELSGGYLARHFFRGVTWVISMSFICNFH